MKKRILASLLCAVLTAGLLTACSDGADDKDSKKNNGDPAVQEEEKELTKVTLNEVAHSIFYAPMYVAIEEGYFEEEGIELDLVCGFGDGKIGRDISEKPRKYVV